MGSYCGDCYLIWIENTENKNYLQFIDGEESKLVIFSVQLPDTDVVNVNNSLCPK